MTLGGPGGPTVVEVTVDDDGALTALGLQRWKDSAKPPALAPFGGAVDSLFTCPSGEAIAGADTVGRDWGTPGEASGTFLRYRVTAADFGPAAGETAGSHG